MGTDEQVHAAVVATVAPGSRIEHVQPYRGLPSLFPARLTLITASGRVNCVVKTAPAGSSRLAVEAAALQVMGQVGARTPRLFAGPAVTETDSGPVEFVVMSVLPGEPVPWLDVPDFATGDRTCRLWITAVEQLHALTDTIGRLPAAQTLARRTLADELADVLSADHAWSATPLFDQAVTLLGAHLADSRLPLVLSNGDYNPLNVLVDHEGRVGWVDFEHAGFEDPLIGMPKFWFWADDSGWAAGGQLGLIERYLYQHRVRAEDFAVRILLRGLTHLRDTTPDDPPVQLVATMNRAIQTIHHTA